MLKNVFILALGAVLIVGSTGCKKKVEPPKPGQLTPEERVRLKANAIKAYEQIVSKYPDSPQADKARERLPALKAQKN